MTPLPEGFEEWADLSCAVVWSKASGLWSRVGKIKIKKEHIHLQLITFRRQNASVQMENLQRREGLFLKVTVRGLCLRWIIAAPPPPRPTPVCPPPPWLCPWLIDRPPAEGEACCRWNAGLHSAWMVRFSFSISLWGDTNTRLHYITDPKCQFTSTSLEMVLCGLMGTTGQLEGTATRKGGENIGWRVRTPLEPSTPALCHWWNTQ